MLRPEPLILDFDSLALYDQFVPTSHPLRQFDQCLDFSFILPLVAERYHDEIGRPAEHPERLFRLLFAQFYLNLSDEKVCLAAHESLALRVFLRLRIGETPLHPTTLQKFRFHRLDPDLYLAIHDALLCQAEAHGVFSRKERQIFDTSHVRSNTRVVSLARLLLEARGNLVREVKKIDAAYGAVLEAQMAADRLAYREERERRKASGEPIPTKDEKIRAAIDRVGKTLGDVRGRMIQESYTVTGVSTVQTFSTTYDDLDRPIEVVYLDGEAVTYQYGDHGKLVALTSSRFGTLIKGVSYNALVKPSQVSWAPGGTTSIKYYGPDQSGIPYGGVYQIANGVETWQYSYDVVGNVSTITDSLNNTTNTGSYDSVHRLTDFGLGGEAFQYDAIGNVVTIDGTSLGYSGTPIHAPKTVGSYTYAYTASGGLQSDGVRQYGYDSEDRLTSVSQNGQQVLSYVYDFDGKRLKRTDGSGTTTIYVTDRFEINLATGETTAYYPWAGQPVPMRQGGSFYLLHTDRNGSITAVTDNTGSLVGQQRYTAYGKLTQSGGFPTDRGYTGQIRDGSDSGSPWDFYFYQSRYYNAAIGKFIQPDTIVPKASNPQALNRYAYALDNPLKLVDPTGHESMDPIWVKQYAAAHHGHQPTPIDWVERQISLASGRIWSSSDWKAFNSIIGSPKEAFTSLFLGAGTTKLAQGKELKIIDSYETGNIDFPRRFLGADVPTGTGEIFGKMSTGLGVATLALDEASLMHEYATGTLRHPANESASTVLKEDMVTVAIGAGAVFVAGMLAPAELVVGVTLAAGIASTLAVGALEQGFKTGDWSWGSVRHGALGAFGLDG